VNSELFNQHLDAVLIIHVEIAVVVFGHSLLVMVAVAHALVDAVMEWALNHAAHNFAVHKDAAPACLPSIVGMGVVLLVGVVVTSALALHVVAVEMAAVVETRD